MKPANDNSAPANAGALTFISMFSGIEAASVAFGPLGWRAICFAEIEKFPSAVLAHHYPDVPNVGDMSAHDWAQYRGKVDIVCGGPPCQAFSVAGLRESLNDARGNLSLVYMKALHAIKPRNAIVENVPGWLNTPDNAFGCFLAGIVGADDALPPPEGTKWPNAGMVAGPRARAAWRILDAQYFGLAQRRKRVIVVADFGNGADPAAVLFEPEGVRRDSPPSREKGKDVAGAATGGAGGGGDERVTFALGSHAGTADGEKTNSSHASGGPVGSGISEELAYSLRAGRTQAVGYAPEIARCDATREGSSQDYESTTMVAVHAIQGNMIGRHDAAGPAGSGHQEGISFTLTKTDVHAVCITGHISHALKAEGADGSEDGAGRGTPIVCVHGTQDPCTSPHTAFALGRNNGGENVIAFAQTGALRGREGGATAELGIAVAAALRASSGGGDKPHVLYAPEIYPTLSASEGGTLTQVPPIVTSAVRRLTPRECERLQGFQFLVAPDYPKAWLDEAGRWWSPDYTAIPYNKVSEAKLDADWVKYMARGNPKNLTRADVARLADDGPRYKALGNSWAVPLFNWLGKRIQSHMPPIAANDNNKQDIASAV